ncbi:hypothetical protein J1C14_000223 [Acinetobacter baumannii]|nr:hypothetical protein [Acinetobacter baumannii]
MHRLKVFVRFLNGVCRHERGNAGGGEDADFLNGVCRHEPFLVRYVLQIRFLNGVCRHELK